MCADVTYVITYPHQQQSSNLRPVSEGGVLFSCSLGRYVLFFETGAKALPQSIN
jgi:hypothetical protein